MEMSKKVKFKMQSHLCDRSLEGEIGRVGEGGEYYTYLHINLGIGRTFEAGTNHYQPYHCN
jgi:hypothetical protein